MRFAFRTVSNIARVEFRFYAVIVVVADTFEDVVSFEIVYVLMIAKRYARFQYVVSEQTAFTAELITLDKVFDDRFARATEHFFCYNIKRSISFDHDRFSPFIRCAVSKQSIDTYSHA